MEKTMTIDHFSTISVIGQGSYAQVLLVKKKDNSTCYAMKILKKENVEKQKHEKYVKVERDVLVAIKHPFIVKLFYTFQNKRNLFFVLEYCHGGELFRLLKKKKLLTNDQSKFFAAQIFLAIEHLHSRNIIYRDLKPENILIDKYGYIKLADFGLSRIQKKKGEGATSLCGTPEYLAPEILLKLPYGKSVDWWTFGSVIYEMLVGAPPFFNKAQETLFENIKFRSPEYPDTITEKAKDLISGLLKKNHSRRLGAKSSQEVKSHPWFEGINWEALVKRKYLAPFVPKVKSAYDVKHFEPEFTEIEINSLSLKEGSEDFKTYLDFSYNQSAVKTRLSTTVETPETDDSN